MNKGENVAFCRFKYIFLVLLAILITCPPIYATKYQEISLAPNEMNKSIGSTFTLSVMYNASDGDETLPGIGIRIHYDSSKLVYKGYSNEVQLNINDPSEEQPSYLLTSPLDKEELPKYTDMDPNTDRLIIIAWADVQNQGWPGRKLPCSLIDLSFQVKADISESDTNINSKFTSVSSGYSGRSEDATIHITTLPTVSWTASTQTESENIGSIQLTAHLSFVSNKDISVPISLAGSADPVTDYNISTQTLVIPSGEQTASLTISIVNDLLIEEDETIEVKIGSPTNALADLPNTFDIIIENDDAGHFTTPIIPTPESVVFYGDDFRINGESADIGDEIGAFDPDGILCGRMIIDNKGVYVLTVYKDDSSTEDVDEGAVENDELTFKVWDLSSDYEYIVSGEMFSPKLISESIPACEHTPPQWTANNDRWGLNISITGNQEIPLRAGWNLFSFSVNMIFYDSDTPPVVATLSNATPKKLESLAEVLTTIEGKYDLIRNFDINGAQTFDPNVPSFFNTLHYLAAGYGYWIKMKEICNEEECKLTLSGPRAKPSDTLTLRQGWNLIGCWHTEAPYDATTMPTVDLPSQVSFKKVDDLKNVFSSINGSYSIVRNFDVNGASTFDPNVPSFFNTLHYVGPGYGYWIKMTESKDFNY
jgi:hypothetical protein